LLYVLLGGDGARRMMPWIVFGMIVLSFFWPGWLLWVVLIFVFGRVHAEPLDTVTPLSPRHRLLAWTGLILFVLVFTPIPLQVFGG
jgi:hypothetical protein